MNAPFWIGGLCLSLWFGWGSLITSRFWPLFWAAAVVTGMITGFLFFLQKSDFAPVWWSLWMAYTFVLPIMRWIRGARA